MEGNVGAKYVIFHYCRACRLQPETTNSIMLNVDDIALMISYEVGARPQDYQLDP